MRTSNRAVNVSELIKKKFKLAPFEGKWQASFGTPELCGSWIIWGQSGSGKSHLSLQLIKYLAQFDRIAFNSLEEGTKSTMQRKLLHLDMASVKRRMILLCEPMDELEKRLKKNKSPNIVVIDSVQYCGFNYRDYTRMKNQFPNKLFIYISHADGKEPKGNTAKSIRFDAHIKIYVEGFRAFTTGRFGGGEPFTIWEDGASAYWITNNDKL